MKKIIIVMFAFITAILLLQPETVPAEDIVSVPWEEIKKLYIESIESKIRDQNPKTGLEGVTSIESADYTIFIEKEKARGELKMAGRVISGDPVPVPIFGRDIIVTEVTKMNGAALLRGQGEDQKIFLLPEKDIEFQIGISFLVMSEEDDKSKFLKFGIPRALTNTMSVKCNPGLKVYEMPGVSEKEGKFFFKSSGKIFIRYYNEKESASRKTIDIDILSKIGSHGDRLVITSYFSSVRAINSKLMFSIPEEANYVSSSLKKSKIKKLERNQFEADIQLGAGGGFFIQFVLNIGHLAEEAKVTLPAIRNNLGKEGAFVLVQPEEGEISILDKTGIEYISGFKLGNFDFNNQIEYQSEFDRNVMRVSANKELHLKIKHFQVIDTPPVVLDTVSFFTSFEETGKSMSVLKMDVPREAGDRIYIKPIQGSEIWFLKVNGIRQEVYTADDDHNSWIIPIQGDEMSHIELAFIKTGQKMGLHGSLVTYLPETGLPSRKLLVGLAMPDRLRVLSVDGPVNAMMDLQNGLMELPAEFMGSPHFFAGSFYKGEGMKLTLFYKEPVDQNQDQGQN